MQDIVPRLSIKEHNDTVMVGDVVQATILEKPRQPGHFEKVHRFRAKVTKVTKTTVWVRSLETGKPHKAAPKDKEYQLKKSKTGRERWPPIRPLHKEEILNEIDRARYWHERERLTRAEEKKENIKRINLAVRKLFNEIGGPCKTCTNCCCGSCGDSNGYFNQGELFLFADEIQKTLSRKDAQNWNGFHHPKKGCMLPPSIRSHTCITHTCNKLTDQYKGDTENLFLHHLYTLKNIIPNDEPSPVEAQVNYLLTIIKLNKRMR